MAPEQARGQPVDKRADIWAFGVVLAEMLSGETLFRGETIADVLAVAHKNRIGNDFRLRSGNCCENVSRRIQPTAWTPDGLRVLFASNRNGGFEPYTKVATGAGGPMNSWLR